LAKRKEKNSAKKEKKKQRGGHYLKYSIWKLASSG